MRSARQDEEASLAARAAWLYFAAGMTQGAIAERLGVPSTKAHRLVARATREGLVKVFIDASVAECVALEETLTERYGLVQCRVAPDLDEGPLPLRALSIAGAAFLRMSLEAGAHKVIGIGHGRTLAAAVTELPAIRTEGVRVVSLLGGLTRKYAANPFDVIHRLAERTGAEAYLLPVPLYAARAEDRPVLLAQMGVAEVVGMSEEATLLVAGIGDTGPHAHLRAVGSVSEAEHAELQAAGAVGEILGHYLDAEGRPVETSLRARAMAPDLDRLGGRLLVAIAGGAEKIAAIRAVLKSGLLKGLITDEATARRLVAEPA